MMHKLSKQFVLGSLALALSGLLSGSISAQSLLDDDTSARGVLKSLSRAEIGTELVAAISDIPFREGQRFEKGDIILTFACERYEAEARSSAAVVEAKQLDHKSKKLLRSKNAIGQFEVDVALAQLREAKANADAVQVRIDQCTIKAPFSGRIIEIFRQAHEFSRANEPLLSIVDDQTLEIDLIVPSLWLRWLKVESPFTFTIDETGEEVSAQVARIGAEVDAVSQTVKITGLFTKTANNTLPGMSGTAQFSKAF